MILTKRKGPILLKIISENRFSGKTYFYTIASRCKYCSRYYTRQTAAIKKANRGGEVI